MLDRYSPLVKEHKLTCSACMQEFAATKLDMLHMETIMLKEFGFIVHVDHPHKLVLNHVNLLHVGVKDPQAKRKLMQEAYNLTNDRCA